MDSFRQDLIDAAQGIQSARKSNIGKAYGQCGQQSFFGVAYGNVAIDVGFDLGFATSLSTENGKSEQFPFWDTQSLTGVEISKAIG